MLSSARLHKDVVSRNVFFVKNVILMEPVGGTAHQQKDFEGPDHRQSYSGNSEPKKAKKGAKSYAHQQAAKDSR
jgi:hypothetical protein